ncbi:hypothetical protein LCGC14_0990530 [marine sediment metagenome]|uniref:UDP-glucose 6-dehydrogenase n=1 Tax=marine sediment metagenome TaxID=412755 RepID=A0A0F9NAI7_9ZZZZ
MNVCVFGLGKLGAPMVAVFASKGHNVIGVDVNEQYVEALNEGWAPVEETGLADMITANRVRIAASMDPNWAVLNSNIIFVVVPTPSDASHRFSVKHVLAAMTVIGESLRENGQERVVVLTSTVMPGTMDREVIPALEAAVNAKNYKVCYNPEFIALGSVIQDIQQPDFILIGESDKWAGAILEEFYNSMDIGPVVRMNFVNAELTKLALNAYVTTKISYANMLGEICEQIPGADARVVTAAIGLDKRIGRAFLRPGTAYGGPCFPRDSRAMTVLAQDVGISPDLSVATDVINDRQARRLADIVQAHLRTDGLVGILGLSYKPGTPITEESASLHLARQLRLREIPVVAYDPEVPVDEVVCQWIKRVDSAAECARLSDVLVIAVPYPEFAELTPEDFDGPTTIIDCWGVLKPWESKDIQYLIPGTNL